MFIGANKLLVGVNPKPRKLQSLSLNQFFKSLMNAKKSGGRPKLPDDERRVHRVNVRLTDFEFNVISTRAKETNQSLNNFLRNMAIYRDLPPAPPPAQNLNLNVEFSRLANNLNQIAKSLHQGKDVDKNLVKMLLELNEKITDIRLKLIGVNSHD